MSKSKHPGGPAYTAVLKLQALTAATDQLLQIFDANRLKPHERKALDHLIMTVELFEDVTDDLCVAVWGEGRGP